MVLFETNEESGLVIDSSLGGEKSQLLHITYLATLGPGPYTSMYSYQNDLVQRPSLEAVSKLRLPEFSGGTWRQPLRSFEVK